jgi:tRNA U55 pseudouridine synthase TruB
MAGLDQLGGAPGGDQVFCLGQGTRVVEFLVDTTKTYLARLNWA